MSGSHDTVRQLAIADQQQQMSNGDLKKLIELDFDIQRFKAIPIYTNGMII